MYRRNDAVRYHAEQRIRNIALESALDTSTVEHEAASFIIALVLIFKRGGLNTIEIVVGIKEVVFQESELGQRPPGLHMSSIPGGNPCSTGSSGWFAS